MARGRDNTTDLPACGGDVERDLLRATNERNTPARAAILCDRARGPRMRATPAAMSPIGKLFATVALIEASTWAGLLVGMYLKYASGTTDLGVWLFGRLHGAAFLLYVVVAFVAGARLRWPMWALLLAVLDV